MKGRLTIIRSDGTRAVTDLSAPPTLEQLREGVGGPIEVVPFFTTFADAACVAFCHEEGKLDGLPVNLTDQALWETAVGGPIQTDILVGPIVIVSGDTELLEAL